MAAKQRIVAVQTLVKQFLLSELSSGTTLPD
jgi:hypothetical protein